MRTFIPVSELLDLLIPVPSGLRYDGVQEIGDKTFLQFTELDGTRASFGATFYIDADELILNAIVDKREQKRVEFTKAEPRASQLARAIGQ